MQANVSVQIITAEPGVPAEDDILHWAGYALAGEEGEITIRVTDEDEMRSLNHRWRNIDSPTNVLSFPLHDAGSPLLGDIAVCAPVLRQEAAQQGKSVNAHWAHIIIHGILHLMGYDHGNETDAEFMEAKETAIMQDLGFPDPYLQDGRAGLQ